MEPSRDGPDGACNLSEYIFPRLEGHADRRAQVEAWSGRERSFKEVWSRSLEAGSRLRESGLGPGARVGLLLENCLEFAELLLGVLHAGAAAAPYPPTSTHRELEHLISVTKPTVLIAPRLSEEQKAAVSKFPGLKIYEELDSQPCGGPVPLCPALLSSPALLLSSSGSTGLPKAVVIRHSALIWAISSLSGLLMGESALGLMPFHHAYGLGLMLMALCEGTTLVIMRKYTLKEFASTLSSFQISHLHVVPSLLVTMAGEDFPTSALKSLRGVFSGAGGASPKVQAALLRKLPAQARLFHSYGMTETTHVVAFGEVRSDKPGSSGKIIPSMRAKIVDSEGGELAAGGRGELWIQGPMLAWGYHNNPAATKEALSPDKWLRTGDLAYLDSDGYLFIVDRIKDIIKYQGHQISVTELEHVIIQHKGVIEVAVVGVEHEVYGEVPKAFVVTDNRAILTEEEILQTVSRDLSQYKWLRGGVKFVQSLPKTESMKINRKILRSMP